MLELSPCLLPCSTLFQLLLVASNAAIGASIVELLVLFEVTVHQNILLGPRESPILEGREEIQSDVECHRVKEFSPNY